MPTMKKLLEIDVKQAGWIKQTAKELGMFEKDILLAVIDYAMSHNVMAHHKQKVAINNLEKTMDMLSNEGKRIATLREQAEARLKELQPADGK